MPSLFPTRIRAVSVAASVAIVLAAPASLQAEVGNGMGAHHHGGLTARQKREIGPFIRSYLKAHPDAMRGDVAKHDPKDTDVGPAVGAYLSAHPEVLRGASASKAPSDSDVGSTIKTYLAAHPEVLRDAQPKSDAQPKADASQRAAEFGPVIKDYLMAHPEVLRDAITELDTREKQAEADNRRKALAEIGGKLANEPDSLIIGNPDGKITLVEFFDYNCGYCKRAIADLGKLMDTNKDLRVVLRDFPILSASSVEAAMVALAAHEQFTGDKYWEFHRKLLGSRTAVGKEQALAVAQSMGADMDKLKKDASDPKTRAAIQQSLNDAQALNLNGTPSYIVGEEAIVGAQGFDEIQKRVENVRKCGKALCS